MEDIELIDFDIELASNYEDFDIELCNSDVQFDTLAINTFSKFDCSAKDDGIVFEVLINKNKSVYSGTYPKIKIDCEYVVIPVSGKGVTCNIKTNAGWMIEQDKIAWKDNNGSLIISKNPNKANEIIFSSNSINNDIDKSLQIDIFTKDKSKKIKIDVWQTGMYELFACGNGLFYEHDSKQFKVLKNELQK